MGIAHAQGVGRITDLSGYSKPMSDPKHERVRFLHFERFLVGVGGLCRGRYRSPFRVFWVESLDRRIFLFATFFWMGVWSLILFWIWGRCEASENDDVLFSCMIITCKSCSDHPNFWDMLKVGTFRGYSKCFWKLKAVRSLTNWQIESYSESQEPSQYSGFLITIRHCPDT